MDNNEELVIFYDNDTIKKLLIISPCVVVILYIAIRYMDAVIPRSSWGVLLNPFLKLMFSLYLALFLLGFLITIFFWRSTIPHVVLNSRGIAVHHYGFIPWDNVANVSLASITQSATPGLLCVAIFLKNPSVVYKQANVLGKIGFWWAKLFGCAPIRISNSTTTPETIISFARRYIQRS